MSENVLSPEGGYMAKKIEKFEDFIAWQKARKLTGQIYKVTSLGEFARDFDLKDQIRRSAVSIMSNIAEGFERVPRSSISFYQSPRLPVRSCALSCTLPLTLNMLAPNSFAN